VRPGTGAQLPLSLTKNLPGQRIVSSRRAEMRANSGGAGGAENMGTTWSYLDMTALGRQEEWEDSPEGYPQTPPYQWWNYNDAYGSEPGNAAP
jgi:predicted dithiol-disulfide oxidoreductase (DUF899 family)